jgi:hypothetical protein
MRSVSSCGESNDARPVATSSSCRSSLSSMRLIIDLASSACCFGLQCISSDRITGSLEVTKAHSATASATSSNFSLEQKVWPLWCELRNSKRSCGAKCEFVAGSLNSNATAVLRHDRFVVGGSVPTINLMRWGSQAQTVTHERSCAPKGSCRLGWHGRG